ncbi:LOG family protein ORF6 in fasciation locus [Psychrobacter pasteurii]|uniref:Cytokinin riboside 5'-monophosphate phosphoribohydrolase n=1 Tax=Psychrobacter pasteurii TaxID=1945520 RepID=A0A1R4ECY7_9GAMM|nr:TIGR00730 family Rossman fold protein [Psychrobacter pasteurii]SJM36318.1 LOG family protein ORF6 in fasciation locus [Psychrobacter pasteurii]
MTQKLKAETNSAAQTTLTTITSKDVEHVSEVVDKSTIKQPLVAVYCGSRMGNNPVYEAAARELGDALAKNDMGLVYGGASIGLMGAVADTVISGGAQAVGVIPTFMLDHEIAHEGLTRLHLTDTMHTRKAIMAEYADAFITLPGGLGTLEEIMEIATWRQLYQHEKPMVILNINGFYDPLIEHLKHTAAEGFMKQEDIERLVVCDDIESAVSLLNKLVHIDDPVATHKI